MTQGVTVHLCGHKGAPAVGDSNDTQGAQFGQGLSQGEAADMQLFLQDSFTGKPIPGLDCAGFDLLFDVVHYGVNRGNPFDF